MKRLILCNAFSISMISKVVGKNWVFVAIREADVDEVKKFIQTASEIISAIGHESTAQVLTQLLGIEVKPNRIMVSLEDRDTILVVFQLLVRLPEGKILDKEEIEKLVKEGKAKFYLVELV